MKESPISPDLSLHLNFLRQWLNEDRITDPKKMVSNEEIWHWLGEAVETYAQEKYQEGELNGRIDELKFAMESYGLSEGVSYNPTPVVTYDSIRKRIASLESQLERKEQ